jgi:hypothetical protein
MTIKSSTPPGDGKLRDRLRKLHALLGSDNPGERENAHAKINELLFKHKLTWNDLVAFLVDEPTNASDPGADADPAPYTVPRRPLSISFKRCSPGTSI